MPFKICKTFDVENGHMLSKHPDKCKFPHGHTRTVEVVLEAGTLDSADMVCDFKALKESVAGFLERFDHAMCMNTSDPMFHGLKAHYGDRVIGFDGVDPTTEVLAQHFFEQTTMALRAAATSDSTPYPVRDAVRVVRVRVWETASSWAEFSE